MDTVAVIDYGMGNIRSVANALQHVAGRSGVTVTSDPDVVRRADRIVFPGQGAARDCMRALTEHGLTEAVRNSVREKPFLGICMGLQVLVDYSEENEGTDCLGVFPGQVRYFSGALNGDRLKIPHMGWNEVRQTRAHPLWEGIPQDSRFYFVHSYYLQPRQRSLTVATTEYGIAFTSAIAHNNVFALQCHPEKSAQPGLALLANFVQWDGTVT